MTEEDTFRALQRPSFREMTDLFFKWFQSNSPLHWDEFLATKHWTRDEWNIANARNRNER